MPALVAFNRRWRVASDDLVFPAAAGLLVRLLWLTLVSIIYGLYDDNMEKCHAPVQLEAFFVGVIVLNAVVILNETAIMYVSMQGTILDKNSRKHIPMLLYIQSALYLPEVCWTCLGTYWVANNSHDCGIGLVIAVCVSVSLQWTIMLTVLIASLVMFDPLGTLSDVDMDMHDPMYLRESTKQLWEKRCRLLCCCFAGYDEQYMNAVSDIAELLAAEFHEADYVASDIAVGLVLLQQEQEAEHRQHIREGQVPDKGKPVDFNKPEESAVVNDASYFMRYSLGSYGWPLYVYMNPCGGPCHLCSQFDFGCWRSASHSHFDVTGDNCCFSNTTALKLQADIHDDVCLKYCSYQNRIYEVPFYVAVDHQKKAVVVAIRGTLSMKDTLTDLTGQQEQLNIEGADDSFAHKGMLQCAHYVKAVLEEKHILDQAFTDAGEDYKLVIVGHSLGAGTASLLSVLLKPTYPNLMCFAYSNPCVLSKSAAAYSQEFIVSVVLGMDVVPRLDVKNLNKLRHDLLSVIKRCTVPKYRVLMSGCWRALYFVLGPRSPECSERRSRSRPYRVDDPVWESNLTEPLLDPLTSSSRSMTYVCEADSVEVPVSSVQAEQLYPAGRILHIKRRATLRMSETKYDVVWENCEKFSKINIHSSMLSDHLPDTVMKALKNVTKDDCHVHMV